MGCRDCFVHENTWPRFAGMGPSILAVVHVGTY